MQPLPRPLASVSLGGSLRASRAALLAQPDGPVAAVDLGDGRPLLAEHRGAVWIEVEADDATLVLAGVSPAEELERLPAYEDVEALEVMAPAAARAPRRRRRRVGTAVALASALCAAAVALATGLSGTPARAVAGPLPSVRTARPTQAVPAPAGSRGGRAAPIRRRVAAQPARAPDAQAAPATRSAATRPVASIPPPTPPPVLPELPAAPAL